MFTRIIKVGSKNEVRIAYTADGVTAALEFAEATPLGVPLGKVANLRPPQFASLVGKAVFNSNAPGFSVA